MLTIKIKVILINTFNHLTNIQITIQTNNMKRLSKV